MLVVYQVAPGQVGLGHTRHKCHGVPSVDPSGEVGLGTLHTSFGAVSDTPAGSPCGWNPNRINLD